MSGRTGLGKDFLIGRTLGHYRVVEEIGAGAMGVVYRARDEHLDRDVAIKILPPGLLADETARQRFHKEAHALSKLNHPNIATVHDFDSCNGIDYLAEELVTGASMDEMLSLGPLSETEIVNLGTQLCEGLAAAHGRGILHRDIKPANLRVTPDGHLKILDFGLAKTVAISGLSGDEQATLSEPQVTAGTLPYMSPEQVRNEKLDARSDIWAAGCVLYEMATGRRPFQGQGTAVVNEILNQAPAQPSKLNHKVSSELETIIQKCLEKDAALRYGSAHEITVDLRRLEKSKSSVAAAASRVSLSWPIRALLAALLVLVLGLTGYSLRHYFWPTVTPSIAVLPFADLSPGHDQEYFSDGLAEQILNDLTRVPNLKVVARTSAFQFKGKNEDLRVIGQKLNVDTVLEGSVRREDMHLRVTAQLIKAKDGFHIWSESYDRDLSDVFAVQDDIAQAVTSALRLKLLPGASSGASAASRTSSSEAYRDFLEARHFRSFADRESDKKASEYIDKAIQADPNYAAAYAFRASANLAQGMMGWVDYRTAIDRARADVEKAVELDPNLPEAYLVLSAIQSFVEGNCTAAEFTAEKARELAPGDADNLSQVGLVAMCLGHQDEAVHYLKQALDLDPLQPANYLRLAQNLRGLGRYEEAEAALKKAIDLNPNGVWVHETLGELYLEQGRVQEALAIMEKEPPGILRDFGMALVFHALGEQKKADAALQVLLSQYSDVGAYQIAQVYAYKGQVDQAFAWLDRAHRQNDGGLVFVKTDPLLQSVRGDPRYRQLLKTLHLSD